MSLSLCGELTAFPSLSEMLAQGHSCGESDDPPEELRKDPLRNWIDPHVGYCTQEDLAEDDGDNSDDEGSAEFEYVHRGMYAQFCAMSNRKQREFIENLRVMICMLIGVSHHSWEPSDAFVLDYIQDETPEKILREMAVAHYLATPTPDEGNPSDVFVGTDEEDEMIRIAHQGGHVYRKQAAREAENQSRAQIESIDHDSSSRYRSRCNISNSRRRTCFYSARRETMRRNWDLYNEDPIEFDAIAQDAAWKALQALDIDIDPEPTEVMPSAWSPVLPWDAFDEEELAEMAEEMHQWVTTGYRPRSWVRRSMFDDDWYDPYHGLPFDDFGDDSDWYVSSDEEPAHPSSCNCSECLAERYANSDDHCGDPMCSHCNRANDIFACYGDDDRSVDGDLVKFGSTDRIRNSVARGRRA